MEDLAIAVHRGQSVHADVQVELQRRRAVLAVVVAVVERHPDQVLGPGDGGERVAVPVPGGEAPERPVRALDLALQIGGHHVVLPSVNVRAVGDVEDAVGVRVAAGAGVQATVDA